MSSLAVARAASRCLARTHRRVGEARALVEAASRSADLFTRRALSEAVALLREIETDTAGPTSQEPVKPAADAAPFDQPAAVAA